MQTQARYEPLLEDVKAQERFIVADTDAVVDLADECSEALVLALNEGRADVAGRILIEAWEAQRTRYAYGRLMYRAAPDSYTRPQEVAEGIVAEMLAEPWHWTVQQRRAA